MKSEGVWRVRDCWVEQKLGFWKCLKEGMKMVWGFNYSVLLDRRGLRFMVLISFTASTLSCNSSAKISRTTSTSPIHGLSSTEAKHLWTISMNTSQQAGAIFPSKDESTIFSGTPLLSLSKAHFTRYSQSPPACFLSINTLPSCTKPPT